MKLNILLFGIAKDIVGKQKLELDGTGYRDVRSLRNYLRQKFPDIRELSYFKIAVNQEFAEDSQPLHEGDEIALIPPVSGG